MKCKKKGADYLVFQKVGADYLVFPKKETKKHNEPFLAASMLSTTSGAAHTLFISKLVIKIE